MSMLENLAAIQKLGIRAFVKSERGRWTCKACGGTIDIHHYRCSECGKEPSIQVDSSLTGRDNSVGRQS